MPDRDLHCPHCQERDPRALLVLEVKDIPRFKDGAPIVICRLCAFVIASLDRAERVSAWDRWILEGASFRMRK